MKEKTTILLAFLVLLSVTFCNFNRDKDKTEEKTKEQTKEKTVQQDKKDENTKSDQQKDSKTEKYPIKKKLAKEDNKDNDGCTYWITSSSHKRHNKSCRWYKNSNGYCTDKQEGIACKICGG
jgi:type III secretory pathway component EscV